MKNTTPPTADEIKVHRDAMRKLDIHRGQEPRDYSDTDVVESLNKRIPGTEYTMLDTMRSLRVAVGVLLGLHL